MRLKSHKINGKKPKDILRNICKFTKICLMNLGSILASHWLLFLSQLPKGLRAASEPENFTKR